MTTQLTQQQIAQIKKVYDIYVYFKTQIMEYNTLYSDSDDMRDLRNKTARDFFQKLKTFYWESFFMVISRLLDSHKQFKSENLSLYILPHILSQVGCDNESIVIKGEINDLKIKYESIVFFRKKYLAHYDIDYIVGNKDFNTTTTLDEIQDFLNEMLILIQKTQSFLSLERFEGNVCKMGDFKGASELIRVLKKAYSVEQVTIQK